MIKDNLRRGINDGLYRDDLNIEIMAQLDYSTNFILINPDFFPAKEFEIKEIKHQYMIYHLRGIATSKGLSIIENKNN